MTAPAAADSTPTCQRCSRTVGILSSGRARPWRTEDGATVCTDTGSCKRARFAAGAPSERAA